VCVCVCTWVNPPSGWLGMPVVLAVGAVGVSDVAGGGEGVLGVSCRR